MIMEVKNLTIQYRNKPSPLLHDINFSVDQGQTVVVTGDMGSGKSTLFWAISKLFSPGSLQNATGEIITKIPLVLISQRIKSQILTFNVSEELTTKMSFENKSRKERLEHIDQIRHEFDLTDLINRDMRNLSSGQQQLVVILANLVATSDKFIILLDEPLSLLDSSNSKIILSLLNNLIKKGNTIIIADTRPEKYFSLSPIYYKIESGRLSRLERVDTHQIEVDSNEEKFKSPEKINEGTIGLNIEIGYSKAFQHINLNIPQRGILVVTGKNGSGKTAFLLTLAKIIKPIRVYSKEFYFPQSVYLPQDTFSFFWKESVEKELEETFDLSKLPEWLNEISLMSPFLLSEGQRKKLGLEICFSKDTTLLLDEPTQSLDHESISWFIENIERHSRNNLVVIATNDEWLGTRLHKEAKTINFKKMSD